MTDDRRYLPAGRAVKVRGLELDQFFTYAGTRLAIPDHLTVLTGPNGAGKSACYEAVVWALTGELVRGSKVRTGRVKLQFDHLGEGYTIKRTRTERGQQVEFWSGPEGSIVNLTGQTATDTQKRIDQLVGRFDRLVAGSIFARDFLSRFGACTDKERKALLEEQLGLQQFDRALKLARDRERACSEQAARADQEVAACGRHVQTWQEERIRAAAREGKDIAQLQIELEALSGQYRESKERDEPLTRREEQARRQAEQAGQQVGQTTERLALAKRQVQQAGANLQAARQACQSCGRPFDAESILHANQAGQQLLGQAEQQAGQAGKDWAAAKLEQALAAEGWDELREQVAAGQRLRHTLKERHQAVKVQLEEARRHQDEQARLDLRVQAAAQDLEDARAKLLAKQQEVVGLQVAVACFGLRGARTILLGRVLDQIGREANLVLASLSPTIRVQLAMTEQDQVQVKVQGAGDGDYRGCSGGERVRIDVALMLGLAAQQGGSGLLVFDEVFDALDQEGVERVAQYLNQLAETRQVLVISHLEDLVARFPRAHHLRARMGDFSQLEPA
jgi:DNA repair exonuclease SbcCD ATPase subunit